MIATESSYKDHSLDSVSVLDSDEELQDYDGDDHNVSMNFVDKWQRENCDDTQSRSDH